MYTSRARHIEQREQSRRRYVFIPFVGALASPRQSQTEGCFVQGRRPESDHGRFAAGRVTLQRRQVRPDMQPE